MPNIFISYTSDDVVIARTLTDALTEIFRDYIGISTGGELRWAVEPHRRIQSMIKDCDMFLAIASPNSIARSGMGWEAGFANALKKEAIVLSFGIDALSSFPFRQISRHILGTDAEHLESLIQHIGKTLLRDSWNTRWSDIDLRRFFDRFASEMRMASHLSLSREIQYQNRISLVLNSDQREALARFSVIPDDASVIGIAGSLALFGFPKETVEVTWRELQARLNEVHIQHLSSWRTIGWAKVLGQVLKEALNSNLSHRLLPLYQSFVGDERLTYRLELVAQTVRLNITSFEISVMPVAERVKGPSGELGALLRAFDFERTLRWGVLQSPRFEYLLKPGMPNAGSEHKREGFLDALREIRIEAKSLNLERDQLLQALSSDKQELARAISSQYNQIADQLESENERNIEGIQELGRKLLALNAMSLKTLQAAISSSLERALAENGDLAP